MAVPPYKGWSEDLVWHSFPVISYFIDTKQLEEPYFRGSGKTKSLLNY